MDSYEVIEQIGQGGMGVVYRALQTSLRREVALKLLIDRWGPPKPKELKRFAREVRAIARLSHPNVIRVLDYGQLDGRLFYAMEYLGHAHPLNRIPKPAPLPQVLAIARQLLGALAAIHREGFVHRDLKPGNVMIDAKHHVTLMDFGLVQDLDATPLTRSGTVIGTPRYLSPEAVQGRRVDGRSDLFALGVILHEALTGRGLFSGDSLASLATQIINTPAPPLCEARADCPPWLASVVAKLLEKEPAARYHTASGALAAVAAGLGEAFAADDEPASPARPTHGPAGGHTPEAFLAESRVILGLDVLRAAISEREQLLSMDADTPTLVPESTSPSPAPGNRSLATPRPRSGAVASPVPVSPLAPRAGWRAGAAGAAALLVAGLTISAFFRGAPTIPAGSPAPAVRTTPEHSASPAAALDSLAVARAATAAVRALDPRARIQGIHAALKKLHGKWDRTPPNPGMVALRDRFRAELAARATAVSLDPRITTLTGARRECFTDPAVPPGERLSLYWALNDLEDLELYCERFGIPFRRQARAALFEGYGQLERPALGEEPAEGFAFTDPGTGGEFKWPAEPFSERWRLQDVAAPQRFHSFADPEESDLMRTLGSGTQQNLAYVHPQPLNFPLDRTAALELSGITSDLRPNAAFEIDLSDGTGFQRVALVRGDHEKPRRWWHSVDRGLFSGPRLSVRVRFRLLPDMSGYREFAYLYRVQVHHRAR